LARRSTQHFETFDDFRTAVVRNFQFCLRPDFQISNYVYNFHFFFFFCSSALISNHLLPYLRSCICFPIAPCTFCR
jgi:hypothetical protein